MQQLALSAFGPTTLDPLGRRAAKVSLQAQAGPAGSAASAAVGGQPSKRLGVSGARDLADADLKAIRAELRKFANSAGRLDQLRQRLVEMARALNRLQSDDDRFANARLALIADDGSTIVLDGDWTYRLEFEAYEGGGFRITEGIHGGEGSDRITVNGRLDGRTRWPSFTGSLPGIDAGGGDDSISISNQSIRSVRGGAGNDAVTLRARLISSVSGGEGNDAIAAYADAIMHIGGGDGSDSLALIASYVGHADGGGGNDFISVAAHDVGHVELGDGHDTTTISAIDVNHVEGGAGDDTIAISAQVARWVDGGTGDDTMVLDVDRANIRFREGDGEDVIALKSGGVFHLSLSDKLAASMDDVVVAWDVAGNLTLSFKTGDRVLLIGAARAGALSVSFGGEFNTLEPAYLVEPQDAVPLGVDQRV